MVKNPNYKNSDKSVFQNQSQETDRIDSFGYKTNKTGFSVGTEFEYFNDLNLGVETSTFYEDMKQMVQPQQNKNLRRELI